MMPETTTGVLLIFGEECFVEVGRRPLCHRLLLSGHRAGVRDWHLVTWHDPQYVHANLVSEPRLRETSWQIHDVKKLALDTLSECLPKHDIIVSSCTTVFDHRLLLDLQTRSGPVICMAPLQTRGSQPSTALTIAAPDMTAVPLNVGLHQAVAPLRCAGTLLTQILEKVQSDCLQAPQVLRLILERLVGDPQVATIDVRKHIWVPLRPPFADSAATAEGRLLRTLGREGDSPLVRKVDRTLSRAVTKRLLHTRITPNQITLVSAMIGLSGAALLAQSSTVLRVLGALLFFLSTIVDGCDGELARLTFRESTFGAKLDVTMDNVVHIFLFCAIALGQYRQYQDSLYLTLGALILGGVLLSMAVYLPYVLRPRPVSPRHARLHECLASRDFAYLLPILAALNVLHWFLWAAVIGTYLFALAWVIISWRERQYENG